MRPRFGLAIPLEASARPFPQREYIIFLTFCVLLATLVGQGGTMPLLLRRLGVKDDGADDREERTALAITAKAALRRLDELATSGDAPPKLADVLRRRFGLRWTEFADGEPNTEASRHAHERRRLERELLDAQRRVLLRLRNDGKVDNTVMRRIQRLLDLQDEEIDLLETTGHTDAHADVAL